MVQTSATDERTLEALAKVPIFARLDDRGLRKLARLCTLRSFAAGDVLFEEGAMALSLFIVTSGQVEVYQGAGDRRMVLETVSAGGLVGHLDLLDDQPRASGAAARETTECLLLTRDGFDTLVRKSPEIAWCLTPALAERLRELQRLAMEAKRAEAARAAREDAGPPPDAAGEPAAAAGEPAVTATADDAAGAETAEEDDDDEASDLGSAMLTMMRLQYGVMAGTARGMTEMAKAMETFLDAMAEETELETSEDWGELLKKVPEAMATATREALDGAGKAPGEMMDAFRRYSDSES